MSELPQENFSNLLRQGKFKEASIFAIDNLESKIEQDLLSANRTFWIDSFNNHCGFFMLLPNGKNEISQLTAQVIELSKIIRQRVEGGGQDADTEEKNKLIALVKEIKEFL